MDHTLRHARMSRMLMAVLLSVILVSLNSCDTTQSRQDATEGLQIQFRAIQNSEMPGSTLYFVQDNELLIDEVKLFIEEMELEGKNIELKMKNFIVNLPLNGSPFIIAEQLAPHGIYKEFELEIEKPDDDAKVDDRDFRDETGSYSIVVKGLRRRIHVPIP